MVTLPLQHLWLTQYMDRINDPFGFMCRNKYRKAILITFVKCECLYTIHHTHQGSAWMVRWEKSHQTISDQFATCSKIWILTWLWELIFQHNPFWIFMNESSVYLCDSEEIASAKKMRIQAVDTLVYELWFDWKKTLLTNKQSLTKSQFLRLIFPYRYE